MMPTSRRLGDAPSRSLPDKTIWPTLLILIVLVQGFGLLSLERSFGVAFWLSFVLHALVAEVYLSTRPSAQGAAAPAVGVGLSGPSISG